MLRTAVSCVFCLLIAGCAGGSTAPVPAVPANDPVADPPVVVAEPQMPAVDGEVIGYPGSRVEGLPARFSWTGLGWLANDDDVIFEAVIMWDKTFDLGCGILRRAADGRINMVLMQGQPLPGTGGGTVMHPRLPLEAVGDTLVIPSRVEDGAFAEGLFLISKSGGAPALLAGEVDGVFLRAEITADGTVLASVARPDGTVVLAIPPGGQPQEICRDCDPAFSTDGNCVVVRKDGGAIAVDLDGVVTPIVSLGDPAPGTGGSVTGVRAAWVTESGSFVVHVLTDDDARPDVLLRIDGVRGIAEVVAACGAPAPGGGTFLELVAAPGRGDDVVFGATVSGGGAAVFCAAPGEAPERLAGTGDLAGGLEAPLTVLPGAIAAGERIAFGAQVGTETGVFLADGLTRVLTTDARVPAVPAGTIVKFLYPLRDAIHAKSDGRTLVHVGIREDRAPDAAFGALLLIR